MKNIDSIISFVFSFTLTKVSGKKRWAIICTGTLLEYSLSTESNLDNYLSLLKIFVYPRNCPLFILHCKGILWYSF